MLRSLPLLLLALFALARLSPAEDLPLAEAVECRPRAGLPNFFAKLDAGGAVKIAYFGGSITAQEGWRPKTLKWFQEKWPQAKLSQVNAAIGGTGSDLGVFRLKQDVLDHQPDLMFVEFAVNDGGASPEQIYRCMEGVVRQTWRALPKCDICFVYTITEALSPPLLEGKFQRSASAMEKIADHYGIPSIHMALEVAKLARERKLEWKAPLPKTPEAKAALGDKFVFAPDSVHPHAETGHELYLQAVARSVPKMREASKAAAAHTLGAPFIASNYENAKLAPISQTTLRGFEKLGQTGGLGKQFANRLPDLHRGSAPGSTVTFKFRGTSCAIYDLLAPDCGQVIVKVDDSTPKIVPRFDSYCTYARLGKFNIVNESPEAVHTVEVAIHPEQPDKAKILAERKNVIDKPERYNGTAFYPGALLIVGELVK